MSGQDWCIKIVPGEGTGANAEFVPDLMDAKPGDALQATTTDIVSWNNRTNDYHQPWWADENYVPLSGQPPATQYLSNEIPPWEPSTPGFQITQSPKAPALTLTIYYVCSLHPDEHGTIEVSAS